MDICCFRKQKSKNKHYEEDYDDKSIDYLEDEKKTLEKKICRENCLFYLYTISSATTGIITVATKGASAPLTLPSTILTTVHAEKSNSDYIEFNDRRHAVIKVLNSKKENKKDNKKLE